ncbi:MAG: hypothetical protein ACRDO2_04320, partial [Nocardioidaceae bacterium]
MTSSSSPTAEAGTAPARRFSVSTLLHHHPRLRLTLLLTPPMLWLGVAYLGALAALFITSLWGQNDFTGQIERVWTLDNFRT